MGARRTGPISLTPPTRSGWGRRATCHGFPPAASPPTQWQEKADCVAKSLSSRLRRTVRGHTRAAASGEGSADISKDGTCGCSVPEQSRDFRERFPVATSRGDRSR